MPNNIGFLRKINKYICFGIDTHSYVSRRFFFLKKNAGGRTMLNNRGFLGETHNTMYFLINTHYSICIHRFFCFF